MAPFRPFEPGDLIVSTLQPKGVLARVLFEPEAALSDSLSYDITAWALPYVYGLDVYALPERLDPDAATYQGAKPPVAVLEWPFAYLVEWKSFADLPFLAAVLRSGIKLRFAEEPFEIDGRRFETGTLILTRTGNEALGDRFDRRVHEAAATFKQPLYRVATAFVTRGADLGSSDVPFLKKPRVVVVAGAGISSYAVGEVWHYFDQQIEYPVTLVEAGDLGWLYHYDVLILPSGSYRTILTDERLDDLSLDPRRWAARGHGARSGLPGGQRRIRAQTQRRKERGRESYVAHASTLTKMPSMRRPNKRVISKPVNLFRAS